MTTLQLRRLKSPCLDTLLPPPPIAEIKEKPEALIAENTTENIEVTDTPSHEQDREALTLADIPGVIAVTRFDQEGKIVMHQQHETERTPKSLEQLTTKFIENTHLKGRYLELGGFTQCVMEYNEGKIVIASGENAGIMIVIHNKTDIGSIRHVIKQEILQSSFG